VRIIPLASDAEPLLDPDLVWDGRVGDLVTTPIDDPVNPGGLRATQALATAILICLMTDARAEAIELRDGDVNRGWPGDSFERDADEPPLGSKLWLLRRRVLSDEVVLLAEDYTRAALQTLIDQGAVARFNIVATADRANSRLVLSIAGYGRDGSQVHDQKYAVLWEQLNGVSDPLA
jgi:phage gp46-like protein